MVISHVATQRSNCTTFRFSPPPVFVLVMYTLCQIFPCKTRSSSYFSTLYACMSWRVCQSVNHTCKLQLLLYNKMLSMRTTGSALTTKNGQYVCVCVCLWLGCVCVCVCEVMFSYLGYKQMSLQNHKDRQI